MSVLLGGKVAVVLPAMAFHWEAIVKYLPQLLKASELTVELVLLSCFLGLIFGVGLGLMRLAKSPILRVPAFLYGFFFRGTPLLVQIFLIYYGLGQFEWIRQTALWEPVFSQAYWCAIIAFTLNTSAYIAEIFVGAIEAIDKGELEAADALGLSATKKLTRIMIPRAFGIMVPAYSNEVIFMIKGSALASTITILDLMGMARKIAAETYLNLELLTAAGLIYLAMTGLFMLIARIFDRMINRYRYYKMPIDNKQEAAV